VKLNVDAPSDSFSVNFARDEESMTLTVFSDAPGRITLL